MDTFYLTRLFQESNMIFSYILIFVVSFFIIVTYHTSQERFIVFLFSVVVFGYYYGYSFSIVKKSKNILNEFTNNEQSFNSNEFILPNVYSVHKNSSKLKFIYFHEDILNSINKLAFIKTYDQANYEIITSLIENFLKNYYNILDNKLDCKRHHGILTDIRKELLNRLSFVYFNVPSHSDDHENIYETLDVCTKQLSSFTLNKLRIVSNICRKKHSIYMPRSGPYPNDTKISVYEMY